MPWPENIAEQFVFGKCGSFLLLCINKKNLDARLKAAVGKNIFALPAYLASVKESAFLHQQKVRYFVLEHRLERKTAQVILHRSGIIGNRKAKNPISA